MPIPSRALSAVACALLAAPSLAAEIRYDCVVLPATSSLTQTTDVNSPFAGTLIGNYDAATNPTGTSTIPGFFGGSGNNPISYTASFALAGDIVSHPGGGLSVGVDLETLLVRITGLDLNMLGGTPGVLAATLNINYQTFHTVAPNAIYPGGVTIPIPLGNGSVTTLRAVQNAAAAPGILVPQKNGSYSFTAVVPVDLITVAEVLGQPAADGTPVPGVLPISGTLAIAADGSIVLNAAISNSSSTTQPITTGGTFTDLPLAIPTVIPAGSTANVLMSGAVTSVTIASGLNASLAISGTRAPIPGDVNGDFRVNSQDITIVLSNWLGSGTGDCTGDGIVDSRDITVVLSNWQ